MNVAVSIDRLDSVTPNGLQRVAFETARALVRGGDRVTILTLRRGDDPPQSERDGVRIVRYDGRGGALASAYAAYRALHALHAERPLDVLHTHFAYSALGPLAASSRTRPTAIARVRTYHGAWDAEAIAERPALPTDRLRYAIEWLGIHNAERVVVLSDYARAQIVARFGVDDARIARIPGGADIERFAPTHPRSTYRSAFGVPPGAFVIAAAGRLVKRKGFDRLVAAIPRILAEIPETILLLGGDGAERRALEAQIVALGLGGHVRLLGHLDATLPDLYRCADVVVVPSVVLETFGLVTVEALAAGTPVIGMPTGATPEILSELEPMLVAAAASSDALAERIATFARSSTRAELTSERLTTFARRYTWAKHAGAVRNVFCSAIDERAHRRGA